MKMSPRAKWWLLAASLLVALPHLDALPVNIMEARNFITAREMAHDGNWILTTLNGQPRYEKPPLPTWITACSGMLFGFAQLFFMRLPAALITLLLVWYAWLFTAKINVPQRQRLASCLILVTSFYVWFAGRDNQWDLYCHAFLLAGIYFLWMLFQDRAQKYRNAILGGAFIGFSILSKGPIAVYALLLPFLVAYSRVYGLRLKSRLGNAKAIALLAVIALALGLSWPLYARYADPEAFIAITAKEAARWNNYNTRPFYYYWNFFLQSGIWAVPSLMALLYPYMKTRVANLEAYRFTLLWTLVSVLLLSLIPEKKSRYLLPVLIPMALNTGFYIEYLAQNFNRAMPRKEKWPAYLGFGVLAVAGLAFPAAQRLLFKGVAPHLVPWLIASCVVLFSCGAVILSGLLRYRFGRAFYGAVALQIGTIVFALPLSEHFLRPDGFKDISQIRSIARLNRLNVYEFGSYSPEIVYEFGSKIPKYDRAKNPEARFGLLAMAQDSLEVKKKFPHSKKAGWVNLNTSPGRKKKTQNRLYRDFYIIAPAGN